MSEPISSPPTSPALPSVDRLVDQDLFRLYLNEIGRVELLSADEEVDLGKRIMAGRAARERLEADAHIDAVSTTGDANGDAPPAPGDAPHAPVRLTAQERVMLRSVVRAGDAAHDRMVETNLRLVVSVAKRYRAPGIGFPDLVQEGNLGLLRAVDKFDPSKGYRFSTYATWWIRQTIGRGLTSQSRTIRIPSHLVELLSKARRAERSLLQSLGREPTSAEVAAVLEISVERLDELRRQAQTLSSLDAPVGDEAGASLGDMIEDEHGEMPADAASAAMMADDLRVAIGELPDREQLILICRFGLDGQAPRTLESVAVELGLTRERVRQLETRALSRLRAGGVHGTDRLLSYLRT